MVPQIGLAEPARQAVVDILNAVLADEFVLYVKSRNYHWNVAGPLFQPLHALFAEQYEALEDVVDDTAERVRSLGGAPLSTMTEFLQKGRLKEHPGAKHAAREMVAGLLADHEALARTLRADVDATAKQGDAGTSDFLTGLMERHEKTAWILRSHLEGWQPG